MFCFVRPGAKSVLAIMVAAGAVIATGCRSSRNIHDVEFAAIDARPAYAQVSHYAVAAATLPQAPHLAGPHGVDEYVRYALSQNPKIQAQRKRVESTAQKVPQAASLKDPTVAYMTSPFYPYVTQTAGGRMQYSVNVAQEVPWKGKLDTQAQVAEAEVDMARAELVASELEVVEQVQRAYYELYYVQQALEITESSRELAVRFSRIADAKFRASQVPQQDYLRAEVEISNIDAELVRLRQEQTSAQARLARMLHVSPDTPVAAEAELPAEQIPQDLDRLYTQAIAARPELHALLAEVRRNRHATDLARLQFFPDFTFAFGYGAMTTYKALAPTSDGIDNINLGVMANIPLYRNRLRAGVHEAEASVVASAREYDNLRDMTQADVKDLFAQATSQQELLRLFDTEIVPKADQTLEVSITSYEALQISFLQLIDNWQQLLRYQLMQQRLQAQLRQTLATLERVVGGTLPPPVTPLQDGGGEPEQIPMATEPVPGETSLRTPGGG